MKRLSLGLALAWLLGAALEARAQNQPVERKNMDPVLRGTWLLQGSSRDRGKTITEHEAEEFCRVSETRVRMLAGERKTLVIEKIMIVKDEDGDPGNIVRFDNGAIWGITKKPKSKYVLVQVFRDENGKFTETIRFLVTVKRDDD
ncbi:MAG TPA: hypothetical protein PKD86_15530 [Gemmatales bacterium]|nr:hypothetical protein [Gemmatales bacterium]HMP60756.1 hypothetical protein [Gemmatales bacterium]